MTDGSLRDTSTPRARLPVLPLLSIAARVDVRSKSAEVFDTGAEEERALHGCAETTRQAFVFEQLRIQRTHVNVYWEAR